MYCLFLKESDPIIYFFTAFITKVSANKFSVKMQPTNYWPSDWRCCPISTGNIHLRAVHLMTVQPLIIRSSRPDVFCKKGVLKNFAKFAGKHLCQSLFIKKETLTQVFSCEICKISKNTFSYRTPPVAVSQYWKKVEVI